MGAHENIYLAFCFFRNKMLSSINLFLARLIHLDKPLQLSLQGHCRAVA